MPERMLGGLSRLNSAAAALAWDQAEGWLDGVMDYLDQNRQMLRQRIEADLPGVRFKSPESTFLAWLDCHDLDLGASPFEFFLNEAKVGLSDGATFGPGGEGCVRLNFATSEQVLTEILDRMAVAVKTRR